MGRNTHEVVAVNWESRLGHVATINGIGSTVTEALDHAKRIKPENLTWGCRVTGDILGRLDWRDGPFRIVSIQVLGGPAE